MEPEDDKRTLSSCIIFSDSAGFYDEELDIFPARVWGRIFFFCDLKALACARLTSQNFKHFAENTLTWKKNAPVMELDIFPAEVWSRIFFFCPSQTLACVRLISKPLKEFAQHLWGKRPRPLPPLLPKQSNIDVEQLGEAVRFLRKKYSLKDATVGNLDEALYIVTEGCYPGNIRYTFDVGQGENSQTIQKLIQLVKYTDGGHKIVLMERSALANLAKLGMNFMKGKKGLPKDPIYGIKLMRTYVEYGYGGEDRKSYLSILAECKKNSEMHQPRALREALIRKKEEGVGKRKQAAEERKHIHPAPCLLS